MRSPRIETTRSGLWDFLLDEPFLVSARQGRGARRDRLRAPLRVKHLLMIIVLASLFCMSARSIQRMEPLGILFWPVLLGFGMERMAGRHGVCGGTLGGVLAFLGVAMAASYPGALTSILTDPTWFTFSLLALGGGACWGFYLSVWIYMLVETVLQQV